MHLISFEDGFKSAGFIAEFISKLTYIPKCKYFSLYKNKYPFCFSISVEDQYFWTSGMVSDCKQGFSWCSVNQEIPKHQKLSLKDGGNCIAFDPLKRDMRSFNCTERLYFVCEVSLI